MLTLAGCPPGCLTTVSLGSCQAARRARVGPRTLGFRSKLSLQTRCRGGGRLSPRVSDDSLFRELAGSSSGPARTP